MSEVVEPAAHYIQDPEGQVMCDECDAAVQTEETGEYTTQLRMELNSAYEIIHTLQESISCIAPFTEEFMKKADDKFVQHYTGLHNFQLVKSVYAFVASKEQNTKLSAFQEFTVTLIKLRYNPSSQDLAYRFDVSSSTISKVLLKWLIALDGKLKPLIMWLE